MKKHREIEKLKLCADTASFIGSNDVKDLSLPNLFERAYPGFDLRKTGTVIFSALMRRIATIDHTIKKLLAFLLRKYRKIAVYP